VALHLVERKATPQVVVVELTVLLARDRPDEQRPRQYDDEQDRR